MYPQQQYIQVQYPQQQQQVLQQGMPPQQQNQQPQQQQSLQTVQQQTMVPGAMMVAPPPPMGYQNSICCMDLQTGTTAVASVILLMCLIKIGLIGFMLSGLWQYWSTYQAIHGHGLDGVFTFVFAVYLIDEIIAIVQLLLAITLLIGANSRNLEYCRCWLISAIVFEIINFLLSALTSYNNTASNFMELAVLIILWLGWLFRLYSIAVVAAFCKELRMYGGALPPDQYGVGGGVVGVGQVTSTSATYYNATDNNAPVVPAQQYQPQQNGYGSPAATPVAAGGYTYN